MKRIVYFLSILVSVFTVNAQTYERLSEEEIAASESYKAVAYNFVYAFINRDTDKLKELAKQRTDLLLFDEQTD